MELSSYNVDRDYEQYIKFDDDTNIAKNDSSYDKYFKQTGYDIWSMLNDNLINPSIKTFLEDNDDPRQNFTEVESSNESSNYFPLAKLLEESWWNVFNEKYLRHSWNWTVTLITAYMLIFVAGVIGNCMAILVVLLRPQMKTVTNMFIMNLAVADLSVIIFCVGPTLLANIFQRK